MTDAVYRIVEHDGGWAYKLGDVFSETFPSQKAAEAAAHRAADEQQIPGEDEEISWEDEAGVWHDETARGTDRPHAYVAEADAPGLAGQGHPRPPERAFTAQDARDFAFAAHDRRPRDANRGARLAGDTARFDPLFTALLAIGCGFVLGLLMRRTARD